jgi:hypothetical protein
MRKKNNKNKSNRKKNLRKKRKTENDVKDLLLHLEDEYRKANISEKDYKELKEKYSKELEKMNNMAKDPPKSKKKKEEEEIEEVTPEVIERLATQLSEQPEVQEEEEKPGFFSKLFGGKKKEKPEAGTAEIQETSTVPAFEEPATEPQTYEEPESYAPQSSSHFSELNKKIGLFEVEIEKLKTMLETVKETGHVTDETIQAISESIGELRSLIFQTDASLKETMVKMEKIDDDISEVKPKEIVKKFREIDAEKEKHNLEMEKLQKKTEDANEKLNKMYEMLKSIGGIENLVDVNKKIQEKLKDVDEAVKYIGRIGAKTEKQFMDLSRGLEDLILFKAKQEDLDESLKDIIKSIDALNVKFEDYMSKKDMDVFREDILIIKKQLESINKVLPLVEVKLPENIIDLRKEREDILLLLDSLKEQYENKKITKAEYKSFKEGNEKRLKEIEKGLEKEWKKVEKMISLTEKKKPEEQPIENKEETTEVKTEKKPEEESEEVKEKEKMDVKEGKIEEMEEEGEKVKKKMEEVKELFEKKEEKEEVKKPEKEIESKEVEAKEKVEETKIEEETPKKVEKPKEKIKTKKRRKKVKKKSKTVKKKEDVKKVKILSEIKKMKM